MESEAIEFERQQRCTKIMLLLLFILKVKLSPESCGNMAYISPRRCFFNPGDLKEVKVILMGQSLETEGGEEGPRIVEIQETYSQLTSGHPKKTVIFQQQPRCGDSYWEDDRSQTINRWCPFRR